MRVSDRGARVCADPEPRTRQLRQPSPRSSLYPDEFLVRDREVVDDDGVVHTGDDVLSGEAWQQGPVLSPGARSSRAERARAQRRRARAAHKIDMLNGEVDGVPPLHADMRLPNGRRLSTKLTRACSIARSRRGAVARSLCGAEDPAEFFAVCSEMFFDVPERFAEEYPAFTSSSRRSTSRIRRSRVRRVAAAGPARPRTRVPRRCVTSAPRRNTRRRTPRSRRTPTPADAGHDGELQPVARGRRDERRAEHLREPASTRTERAELEQ